MQRPLYQRETNLIIALYMTQIKHESDSGNLVIEIYLSLYHNTCSIYSMLGRRKEVGRLQNIYTANIVAIVLYT